MNSSFFRNLLASRLLRPVFIILVLAGAAQLLLSQWLIRTEVDALSRSVESSLEAGRQTLGNEFAAANEEVDERLSAMRAQVTQELIQKLEAQLNERQQQIAANLEQAVVAEAQGLADVMAAVSAPLIWDRDIPKLTGLVELMDARESVVFAAFFDQYGERMTRYVDRTDPRVKALMDQGEGRGAVGRVMDAAQRDPDVIIISADIAPQGSAIGQLRLGLSTQSIARDMRQLEADFDATIEDSAQAVSSVLASRTGQVSERLQQQLSGIEDTTRSQIQATVAGIGAQSGDLTASLSLVAIVSTLVLLVLIALVLGIGVLRKIHRLDHAIWDIADGDADLTQRVHLGGNSELTHMADGMNRFIGRIQTMIGQVNAAAHTAAEQAREQSAASSQAVAAVNQQQTEIDQMSATVSEMSGSIQEVAENIQQVADSVRTINTESATTADISRQARGQLDLMVSDVEAAVAVVTELNQQSDEIGSVLSVIGGIAEQTNLLALNAAIEAARAGESGRGFAVVADEVRSLASKTQQSTTEIRAIIDRLQEGSHRAVSTIAKASERVAESSREFRAADEHFEQINSLLGELQGRAVTISAAAEEQSTQARQISDNVGDMARAAESTVLAIRQSDTASQAIETAVGELRATAEEFRV